MRLVYTEISPGHIWTTLYKQRICNYSFFLFGATAPQWARALSFTMFLDHTRRRTTVGWIPLDGWSARRRDLYLKTPNTHNRKTSMSPGGIRTHNISRRTAADLRLIPRGHWDRRNVNLRNTICGGRGIHILGTAWFRPCWKSFAKFESECDVLDEFQDE